MSRSVCATNFRIIVKVLAIHMEAVRKTQPGKYGDTKGPGTVNLRIIPPPPLNDNLTLNNILSEFSTSYISCRYITTKAQYFFALKIKKNKKIYEK